MKIDYYIFSLNKIRKRSINTESELYISHNNKSVTILVYDPFDYVMTEMTYSTNFEITKKSAILLLSKEIENQQKELDFIKNSIKAFNE